jgi:hypothetical protein
MTEGVVFAFFVSVYFLRTITGVLSLPNRAKPDAFVFVVPQNKFVTSAKKFM